MIFMRYPFSCDRTVLDFRKSFVSAHEIAEDIRSNVGCTGFSLFYDGKKLQCTDFVPNNSAIYLTFPLLGGKGGFGSMLRAIGAQIEKTTNREACRDLSGRRLRDINEEQRLKKWIAKEAEREAEKIKRRQARIERLKAKAPHQFFDFEYEKEISELPERVDEALSKGLQKVKQPQKRSLESEEKKVPKKSWLIEDLPISSSDSDSDETASANKCSPSKKLKMTSNDTLSSYDSESSQFCPSTSNNSAFIVEASTSSNSEKISTKEKNEEKSVDTEKMGLVHIEENVTEGTCIMLDSAVKNIDIEESTKSIEMSSFDTKTRKEAASELSCKDVVEKPEIELTRINNEVGKNTAPECNSAAAIAESEMKDDTPIDLQDFQNVSELEALGLDRLKFALMARGLKCGGTLSDRAQRLWKVRGLQPHQYPTNLLARTKK